MRLLEWFRRRRMVRIWYGDNQHYATHYIGWIARLRLRWECHHGNNPGGPRRWEFEDRP